MSTIYLAVDFNILEDGWFTAVLVMIIVLTLSIILLFTLFWKLNNKVDSGITARKHNDSKSFTTKRDHDALTELNQKLQTLENKINEKSFENADIPASYPNVPMMDTEKSHEIHLSLPKKPEIIEFYMSTPNPDGTFDTDQSSDSFRKTISLFKFRANPQSPSTASFEFFSDESGMKDALSNPKRYLEPVCYEENDPFTGAKKIIVQRPGIANKQGNKWVVEKNDRLIIKYQ